VYIYQVFQLHAYICIALGMAWPHALYVSSLYHYQQDITVETGFVAAHWLYLLLLAFFSVPYPTCCTGIESLWLLHNCHFFSAWSYEINLIVLCVSHAVFVVFAAPSLRKVISSSRVRLTIRTTLTATVAGKLYLSCTTCMLWLTHLMFIMSALLCFNYWSLRLG